jgi:hypothetical protein
MDPPPSQPPPAQPYPYPGPAPTPPYPYYPPPSHPYGAAPPGAPYQYLQAPPTNGLAITSFVIGIVAIVLCWIPILDLILSVPALILGVLGMSKANQTGGSGKGLAISGLVLGAIASAMTVLVIILYLTFRTTYGVSGG